MARHPLNLAQMRVIEDASILVSPASRDRFINSVCNRVPQHCPPGELDRAIVEVLGIFGISCVLNRKENKRDRVL
jgi:hypothetical protein